ncbi:replication initiation protein [Pseudodesulfovibrio senegalensis]|uniref:Replication initiation protein n=1 Tax=Pseudodesulfovibrio senegalensis TaxID=1721087 RepID=A0A6N6MYQ7_9BACT|nr:replication initiation protein [Pseudodesulfovibrio senegalensis]KAB1437322.1 replication initiation protein [Pseudodesulfovibrio senegalensis]
MKNENDIVAKHNDMIPTLQRLELQELRLLAFCLSHIDSKHDTTFFEITASVQDLIAIFKISPNAAYEIVKQTIKSINQKPAEYEEDGEKVLAFWFQTMRYTPLDGKFTFKMNPDLAPRLLDLRNNFTEYRLKDVYQFKSASTWHLYEILRQWKSAGKVKFDLNEFKMRLGVAGRYPRFSDLKKRILDPGQRDIAAYSDIKIEYEKITKARKVVALRFFIVENQSTKTHTEKVRAVVEKQLDHGQCFAPELAAILRDQCRMHAKQARQLANLAAGDDEQRTKKLIPKLIERYKKIPAENCSTSLGGYCFKALRDELTRGSLI